MFAFHLLNTTCVTTQVGHKHLLATSSESHWFEIEIKKEFDGKDRI
jgi:hypothetical protein